MIINYDTPSDYYKSITDISQNSLNIENCSTFESYTNEELSQGQISHRNLQIISNYFIEKYYDKILESANKIKIEESKRALYYRNPKRLSYDKYGTISFWYLILMVNGWNSPIEMTTLDDYIMLPDVQTISDIITQEEFYKK